MIDMSEGCEHCDAKPGEPCDPVAAPHGRHVACTMACAWKQRQASEKNLPALPRVPIIELDTTHLYAESLIERMRSEPNLVILEAPRPESDAHALPTYHQLLDHLCTELGVPGSPSFWEAVAHVKRRLEKGTV